MELRQLRYFVAVAGMLNFSRAAESLYISQSGLSQQIADLEREFGVILLQRDKRSVHLTIAGETLLEESKKLLHQTEKLIPLVRQNNSVVESNRKIYIGVDKSVNAGMDSAFRVLLTDSIYNLRKKVPGLRPMYFTYEHFDMRRALDDGVVDIAFFMQFEPHVKNLCNEFTTKICQSVLCEDELVLVLRSDHEYADTMENVYSVLNKRGLILLENETNGMTGILQVLSAIGAKPNIRFSDNRTTMVLSTESGEGATVLPVSIVRSLHDPHLRIMHFNVPQAHCLMLAVWKRNCGNVFIEQLVKALKSQMTVL